MKFVKISERLPEKPGKYFTRYTNYNGLQRAASFFDGWKFPHHTTEIEWLDENSGASTVEVERGVEKAAEERSEFLNCVSKTRDKFVITIDRQDWNTEMRTAAEDLLIIYDQMKEVIAGVKDADADKFEFAEWAYDSFCKSNENNWFKPGLAGGTVYYTTEQLYNLFKQKK